MPRTEVTADMVQAAGLDRFALAELRDGLRAQVGRLMTEGLALVETLTVGELKRFDEKVLTANPEGREILAQITLTRGLTSKCSRIIDDQKVKVPEKKPRGRRDEDGEYLAELADGDDAVPKTHLGAHELGGLKVAVDFDEVI